MDDADDSHDDGEDTGGKRDGDLGKRDCLGNGLPSDDGGGGESTSLSVDVSDTGVGGHEEDEDTGGEEDGDDGAHGLCVELQVRRGSEEETNTEVADEVGGDVGCTGGNVSGNEVDTLGILEGVAVLGDATKDKLRSLGRGRERSSVSDGTAIDAEEGKDETEDAGQDGKASVDVELKLADETCGDDHDNTASHPNPHGDLLLWGRKVFEQTGLLFCLGGLLGEEAIVLTAFLEATVDRACKLT